MRSHPIGLYVLAIISKHIIQINAYVCKLKGMKRKTSAVITISRVYRIAAFR